MSLMSSVFSIGFIIIHFIINSEDSSGEDYSNNHNKDEGRDHTSHHTGVP